MKVNNNAQTWRLTYIELCLLSKLNSSVIKKISKWLLQENIARQIFQKTNISYTLKG